MSLLSVFDGMKRPPFSVKIDVEDSTEADLFRAVAKSYKLELDPIKNLRIIFVGKELRYTGKKLRKDSIVNNSTIAVIFRLPDKLSTASATTEDANVVEPVDEKTGEENKDIEEGFVAESVPVKRDEECTDAKEVSVAESVPVKRDEECTDAKEVSVAESVPVKRDEECTDAKEVSVAESVPVKRDEECTDAKEVSVAESVPVKRDEECTDAKEVSVAESVPVKRDEECTDAKEVSVAESVPVKRDEECTDAKEVSVAESVPVKRDEECTDAKEVSVAESVPVKRDEECTDAKEFSVAESVPVKRDEECTDAKEVFVAESVPVKRDEECTDAKEVSVAESVPGITHEDEESKDAEDVPVAEFVPLKAKMKSKKKKRKDAKVVPVLENAADSLTVTTDKENKEVDDDIPAAESEPVKAKKKRKRNKRKTGKAVPGLEEEKRPVLQNLPEILALTFDPDFLDFDMTQCRAKLPPCSHVMGSETMRYYCQDLIDNGSTKFSCPYLLFPFLPDRCPAVWEYRHVRHVACFTATEMHDTEKTIAINFVGKDNSTLTCPRCFTWCSKVDPKQTRMRCFVCTRETGKEFLFCGYCLREWKNARSGRCANPKCKSIEATLDILRNSPKTNLFGGEWPTIRLCPRCGILTEFAGGCSQMHCQLCGYFYCFLCLKGAKSKGGLRCKPYLSECQQASIQTSIPQWDGRDSD